MKRRALGLTLLCRVQITESDSWCFSMLLILEGRIYHLSAVLIRPDHLIVAATKTFVSMTTRTGVGMVQIIRVVNGDDKPVEKEPNKHTWVPGMLPGEPHSGELRCRSIA